jgi:hypothetical protein
LSVWDTIVREAEGESPLWSQALLPSTERSPVPVFSPLADPRFALGLESIYEGYLLHYGRPRLFARADRDTAILLGDYLYAHGLVRIAALGEVTVVSDLAELLSLCAHVRAERRRGDGPAWAATVALLGLDDGRLDDARRALRERGDETPLESAAAGAAGRDSVARALALHRDRVD